MKNITIAGIFYIIVAIGLILVIITPDISDKIIVSTATISNAIIAATYDIRRED